MEAAEFERRSEEHRRAVLAYVYLCCRDLHLAEDIVQETLVIAFQKRDQYFPEADFGAWLISIARNIWYRERERRGLAARAARFIEEKAALLFEKDRYAADRWEVERRALADCLRKLGGDDRGLLEAHFRRGLKYPQIAHAVGRTVAWVKVRMFRIRSALLQCMRLSLGKAESDEA